MGPSQTLDLSTVLNHEFGHVLGFEHDHGGVMEPTLAPAVAPLPLPQGPALVDGLLVSRSLRQERATIFSELGQTDHSDTLDAVLINDAFSPSTPTISRLDSAVASRLESLHDDALDDALRSLEAKILEDLLEDVEGA